MTERTEAMFWLGAKGNTRKVRRSFYEASLAEWKIGWGKMMAGYADAAKNLSGDEFVAKVPPQR